MPGWTRVSNFMYAAFRALRAVMLMDDQTAHKSDCGRDDYGHFYSVYSSQAEVLAGRGFQMATWTSVNYGVVKNGQHVMLLCYW